LLQHERLENKGYHRMSFDIFIKDYKRSQHYVGRDLLITPKWIRKRNKYQSSVVIPKWSRGRKRKKYLSSVWVPNGRTFVNRRITRIRQNHHLGEYVVTKFIGPEVHNLKRREEKKRARKALNKLKNLELRKQRQQEKREKENEIV
jgi:hypothetical protein